MSCLLRFPEPPASRATPALGWRPHAEAMLVARSIVHASVPSEPTRRALECDYDIRPERLRLAREILRRHGPGQDVHSAVAARFISEHRLPVIDIGCGEGELARHLPPDGWVGVDSSPTMIAAAPSGARLGAAEKLPFDDGSFGGAALLFMLYHLQEPNAALSEARRVLRPGALVAAAAPSRHDSPELAFALGERSMTFDAEIAPDLFVEHFADVEVQSWDAPLVVLPDRDAVRDYLIGKTVSRTRAGEAARHVKVPLTVTKRGAIVWGYKR